MSTIKTLKNGIISENPTFVQVLGMCPTLAVTTSVFNGMGMGLATAATLVISNIIVALVRGIIPIKARVPGLIVIIASVVIVIQMMVAAYLPALDDALGIFLPLIVVNCIVLGRAEAFAIKNGPLKSAVDGLGMGLGFAISLTMLSAFRELLGSGSLLGFTVLPEVFPRTLLFVLPPGAFLILGILMASIRKYASVKRERAVVATVN